MTSPKRFPVNALLLAACGMFLGSCGGQRDTLPPVTAGPSPTLSALSPNSSDVGAAPFTLSVVGSNFVSGSLVQWNTTSLVTTFVSSQILTAEVPAIVAASGVKITVNNPGTKPSNSLNFAVPCDITSPISAASQTRARVGAFYFDGWSGPLTNRHFQGLPLGPYQDRQPLSGWQDNSICAIEQQLAFAHNFGIDFFVFDWDFNAEVNYPGENLNSALQITQQLTNRHGMQFAILFVNGPPFDVPPPQWMTAVNEWVGYMQDPDYVHVNGKPVFFVINVGEMRQTFETSQAVQSAFAQLRQAAIGAGLGDIYIVGGFGPPNGSMGQHSLSDGFSIAKEDGYDAIGFYGYPFAPTAVNGAVPFSTLADAGHWMWNEATLSSPLPFIPTAMTGWDPRPWNEAEPITGDLMWYTRTPQDVAGFVDDAISWSVANPQLRPEPTPTPPLVLIEAWNEFGEGSHVLPTIGEGSSYGDALAAVLNKK